VLLPEEAIADMAIKANTKLVESFGSEIVLNKEDCLPHISLAMGCVDKEGIASIGKILRSIAKENPLRNLTVLGIQTTGVGSNAVSAFKIERTKELQSLHEMVTERLAQYFSYNVTADMIADAEVEQRTLQWISGFREKSSYENFSPHITIGYGEMENPAFSMDFTALKLALCHLGNHCTCRKLLVSVEL
jgi:2'-5' RNA ligase